MTFCKCQMIDKEEAETKNSKTKIGEKVMIFAILIGLIVIALIASGLGVDVGVVIAILAGLVVIFLVAACLWPDEKDTPEKAKKKKKISKILLISIPVVLVILIIGAIIGTVGLFDSSSSDAQYDHMMGGYDYGDNYYYDSNDNAVNEKLW